MAFCEICRTQVQDGVGFCPNCGGAISAAATQPSYGQQQPYAPPPQQQYTPPQQQYGPPQQPYGPPQQPYGPPQANDAEANKLMAIVAYFLFFVPLITGDHKKSAFVRFHTNQGTVLFLTTVAVNVGTTVIRAILTAARIYGLGTIVSLLGWVPLILLVLGVINAANSKMEPLPIVGGFTIIK